MQRPQETLEIRSLQPPPTQHPNDDYALMRAISAGEAAAFKTFYIRHSATVYTLCLRMLHDPQDAEQLLTGLFFEIWTTRAPYDETRVNPLTHLLRITRSRAIDKLRRKAPLSGISLDPSSGTDAAVDDALPLQQPPAGAWEKLEMRIDLHDDAAPTARNETRRVADMTMPPSRGPSAFIWSGWAAAALVAIFMGLLLRNANVTADQRVKDAFAKTDEATSNLALAQQALIASSAQTDKFAARLAGLEQKIKDLDADRNKLLLTLDESRQDFRTHFETLMHAQQFTLAPNAMPGVTGTLFWNKTEGTWTLMASHLKPAPAGKTYELWITTQNGDKIPAGTFSPDAAGNALHEVPIPADAGPLSLAAVTDEPAAGVQKPTGSIQFSTDVTKPQ
jgi:DNA-directed RNA polymerase specialized sigma24 family protein